MAARLPLSWRRRSKLIFLTIYLLVHGRRLMPCIANDDTRAPLPFDTAFSTTTVATTFTANGQLPPLTNTCKSTTTSFDDMLAGFKSPVPITGVYPDRLLPKMPPQGPLPLGPSEATTSITTHATNTNNTSHPLWNSTSTICKRLLCNELNTYIWYFLT
jgi:hypothetical protein